MAGLSDYLENAVLNYLRGVAMPTAPTTIYVGLFSSDPTDATTGGTEVTTTIRTAGRVAATFATASTAGTISNTASIDFGASTGNATVSHVGLFDAPTGGNKLYSGPLATSKSVTTGDPTAFSVGTMTLTLD